MGSATTIQWATHTASPWYGCQHATLPNGTPHPGCLHCYAESGAKRSPATLGEWGPGGTRVVSQSFHSACRRWNKQAERSGVLASVFPSLCDPFEEFGGEIHAGTDDDGTPLVPYRFEGRYSLHRADANVGGERATLDDLRRELFATIDSCPWLDFLLLTKRPQNVRRMWPERRDVEYIAEAGRMNDWQMNRRENIHLITSISDQQTADAMIPALLECRDLCPVLGVSAEPLLGPVDLISSGAFMATTCTCATPWATRVCKTPKCHEHGSIGDLDWVIVGGESGPKARPCRPEWIRAIVTQCREASVPCFVKQMGSNVVTRNDMVEDEFNNGDSGWPDPDVEHHIHGFREDYQGADCRIRLRDRKGGQPDEWPSDLRVRDFPTVA